VLQDDTNGSNENEMDIFFENIYKKYYPLMLNIAKRYFKYDLHTAKDAVQGSVFVIYKRYDQLHDLEEHQLMAYIAKTVKSVSLNILKKLNGTYSQNISIEDMVGNGIDITDNSVDIQRDFLSTEGYKALKSLILGLSEKLRDVAKLFLLGRWSHDEISEELGISIDTSKQRLSRARKELKKSFHISQK